jgi:hypothetical protein
MNGVIIMNQLNQDLLNEVVKRVMFEVMMNNQAEDAVEVEVEEDEWCPECDYISALEEEIDELRSENSDLKEELAERTIADLFEENEFLLDELQRLKAEHNDMIDSIIGLLYDDKM